MIANQLHSHPIHLFPKLSVFVILWIGFLASLQPAQAGGITNPVVPTFGTGDPGIALAVMIAQIWKGAVVLGAIFFVLYFLWGAFRWMTAEADKTKFESGRQDITNAVIGLVLLASSVAIIELLGRLLDIQFLRDLTFTFPSP